MAKKKIEDPTESDEFLRSIDFDEAIPPFDSDSYSSTQIGTPSSLEISPHKAFYNAAKKAQNEGEDFLAFYFFKLAFNAGSDEALLPLLELYFNGKRREKDVADGWDLLIKACQEDNPGAYFKLGQMYSKNHPIILERYSNVPHFESHRIIMAFFLYYKAAKGGDIEAKLCLAFYIEMGLLGKPNKELARTFIRELRLDETLEKRYILKIEDSEGSYPVQDLTYWYTNVSTINKLISLIQEQVATKAPNNALLEIETFIIELFCSNQPENAPAPPSSPSIAGFFSTNSPVLGKRKGQREQEYDAEHSPKREAQQEWRPVF